MRVRHIAALALAGLLAAPSMALAQSATDGFVSTAPSQSFGQGGFGSSSFFPQPPGFSGMGWNNPGWGQGAGWNSPGWGQQPWGQGQMGGLQQIPQQGLPQVPGQPSNGQEQQQAMPQAAATAPGANRQGGRVLRDGDVLRGNARAVSGSSLTVEGVTLPLAGLSSPSPGDICGDGRGGSWHCGDKARDILSGILSRGPVRCTYAATPSPSLRCTLGLDDVGRIAALDGAVLTQDREYIPYAAEARADRRGIWASAEPQRSRR